MPDGFTLAHPWAFALLIPFLACARFCPMRVQSIFIPHVKVFQSLHRSQQTFLILLKWLSITAALIALSGPMIKDHLKPSKQIGYDIALLLDTSGSMKEMGFDPTDPRLDKFRAVQEVAGDFIDRRAKDNLALVVFGEYAFIASPLTFDKKILLDILQRLGIGMAGEKTAINDAIALSMRIFEKSEAKSKIAILLTDGMNTAGRVPANAALNMAQKQGVKVYTIGIGRAGNFDVPFLKKIAQETGGEFFMASNKLLLKKVYDRIDQLEKSEIKGREYVKKEQLFIYPLFLSIITLLLYIYLRNQRGM